MHWDEQSFDSLMDRLRDGDDRAAREVFRRFAVKLIRLAAQRLDERLRQKEDAEDVVQSAFRSFFDRFEAGQFEIDGWDGLWGLLAVITLRKCAKRAEHYHAERRDVRREVSLADSDGPADLMDLVDPEPTPADALQLLDEFEQLVEPLSDRDAQIVSLSMQGYSTAEIAQMLDCTQRTVQRVLLQARRELDERRRRDP